MIYENEASYLDSEFETESEAWPSDYEAFGDFDSESSFDYDSVDSYGEARRKRPARPRPVKPARGRLVPKRPPARGPGNFVSQAAFAAAMAKVERQNAVNGAAIKTVDTRVRTVIADTQKLQAQTRKSVDKLRSDLRTTQTLSALIPMLTANNPTLATVAPLAHLVMGSGGGLAGGQGGEQPGAGGLLGNTNNLITIGALAYASGFFKPQQ